MGDYTTNKDLPERVRAGLTDAAQDVYRLAYNNAVAAGDDHSASVKAAREAVAEYLKQNRD